MKVVRPNADPGRRAPGGSQAPSHWRMPPGADVRQRRRRAQKYETRLGGPSLVMGAPGALLRSASFSARSRRRQPPAPAEAPKSGRVRAQVPGAVTFPKPPSLARRAREHPQGARRSTFSSATPSAPVPPEPPAPKPPQTAKFALHAPSKCNHLQSFCERGSVRTGRTARRRPYEAARRPDRLGTRTAPAYRGLGGGRPRGVRPRLCTVAVDLMAQDRVRRLMGANRGVPATIPTGSRLVVGPRRAPPAGAPIARSRPDEGEILQIAVVGSLPDPRPSPPRPRAAGRTKWHAAQTASERGLPENRKKTYREVF